MKRNFKKYISDEQKDGFKWSMWQVEQLASLEEFKKKNVDLYIPRFQKINDRALKVWAKGDLAHFFEINSRAVRTLINSTMNDLKQAEYAMLRKCNDEYRKIIFNAQTYFVTGSGSLKQAIDMASHDFLSRGINCVVYKDGKHVNIANYAEMSLRTTNKRVRLYSDGEKRKELGIHTVKVSSYGACSKLCQPWQGRVYVDDVYSGGTAKEAEELHLPLLSTAIQGGLFHPNCRHHLSTYYPGTQNDDDGDPRDNAHPVQYDAPYENPPLERQHRINQLEIQKQKRIALGSMVLANIEQANQRLVSINSADNKLLNSNEYASENPCKQKEITIERLGKLNENIYSSFSKNIRDDEVIITSERMEHVKIRHPEAYDSFISEIKNTINNPDYIFEDKKHQNTLLVTKKINEDKNNILVLKVALNTTDKKLNSSVISGWNISDERLENYKKHNKIIYSKEK